MVSSSPITLVRIGAARTVSIPRPSTNGPPTARAARACVVGRPGQGWRERGGGRTVEAPNREVQDASIPGGGPPHARRPAAQSRPRPPRRLRTVRVPHRGAGRAAPRPRLDRCRGPPPGAAPPRSRARTARVTRRGDHLGGRRREPDASGRGRAARRGQVRGDRRLDVAGGAVAMAEARPAAPDRGTDRGARDPRGRLAGAGARELKPPTAPVGPPADRARAAPTRP